MKLKSLARMRFGALGSMSLCVALVACQSTQEDEGRAVEANDLGVTRLVVDRHTEGADRFLEIHALDRSGTEIATAVLRTGMIRYSSEPDVSAEVWAAGTDLRLTVGEDIAAFTSPDREAHTVPAPSNARLASFARLPGVASEIAIEAGIGFSSAQVPGEVALAAQACFGAYFPTTIGGPKQCCQDGLSTWHKIGTGSTSEDKLGYRTYNTACRTSGLATGCTTNCYYGPCGSHNETVASQNTTSAAVFVPTGAPTQCGRDSNGSSAGGGIELPEAYTGSQSLYAATTATCPWTACSANGFPAYDGPNGFNLTLEANCMEGGVRGSVTWNGNTVSCVGNSVSQTFWAPDAGAKTVSKSTSNYFYSWEGPTGCNGTGVCSGSWTTDSYVRGNFTGCSGGC